MRERAWAPKCCSRCSDGRGACERGPPRSDSLIDACQLLVVQQAMASAASAETATALVCRLASARCMFVTKHRLWHQQLTADFKLLVIAGAVLAQYYLPSKAGVRKR